MFNPATSSAIGRLLLRLTTGGLLLFHGVDKLTNPGSIDFIGSQLAAAGWPAGIAWGVYAGEVLAPLMLIAGFHARIGGLLVAINMLVAVLLVHSGDFLTLTQHGGWRLELQAFYLCGGLAVLLLGSGRIALKPD